MISPAEKLAHFFTEKTAVRAEDYIQFCLHEPNFGYYATHVSLGRHGDFSTAATLGTGLAKGIAKWLQTHAPHWQPVHIIEIGAGDGSLAANTLSFLPWHLRKRVRLHFVETSPVLIAKQRTKIPRARHHNSMESALESCQGNALIWSNEVVDAFAPVILQWQQQSWVELGIQGSVTTKQLQLKETPLPLSPSRQKELNCTATSPENWNQIPLQEGQRIEIPLRWKHWLGSWLPFWRSGRMLTIDYGHFFPQLYQNKQRGTLRSYFHHQRITGKEVWSRPGKQDITFDVNFSTLAHWHQQLHLLGETTSLQKWLQTYNPNLSKSDPTHLAGDSFFVREDSPNHATK